MNKDERVGMVVGIGLTTILLVVLLVILFADTERPMPKKDPRVTPDTTQQGGGTQGYPGDGSDNGLRKNLQGPTPVPEDK